MKYLYLFLFSMLLLWSCNDSSDQSTVSSEPETETVEAVIDSFLIRHEAEVLAYEAEDRKQRPVTGLCLFTGSSSVRLWQKMKFDLRPLPVINRGFGGSTFRELNYYFDRLVLPYRPKMVVLYEGDNDIVDPDTSPEDVLKELHAFRLKRDKQLPTMHIYMMAVKPSPSRRVLLDKARETNNLFIAYCDTARNVSYLDMFSPIMKDDGTINGAFFGPDSLHMNQSGYDAWADAISDTLLVAYGK